MNSCFWTFVGNRGRTSKVILKHGRKSGNLIIFCNNRILLIDYDVFDDKNYSFFIEEEFCEIFVKKEKDKFTYAFEVSEEVDTPINRERKKYYSKKYKETVRAIQLSVAIVVLLIVSSIIYGKYAKYQDIQQNLAVAKVSVKAMPISRIYYNATYTFMYEGRRLVGDLLLETISSGQLIADNGMPLEGYEEFYIEYSSINPLNNRIKYDKPTIYLLEQYRARIAVKMQNVDPGNSRKYCDCVIDAVYKTVGVNGFADLYFQDVPKEFNEFNNERTYQKLMGKSKVATEIKKCKQ